MTNIKHQIENESRNNKKIRRVTDQAISSLCQKLDETDVSDIYTCTNVQDAHNLFHMNLMKAYDKCIPLVNRKSTHVVSLQKHGLPKEFLSQEK